MSYVTPWSGSLAEGTYRVEMPASVISGTNGYSFKQWENGSTNPVRTVNLTAGTSIVAMYQLNDLAANITSNKTSGDIPLPVTFTASFSGGTPPYTVTLDYGDGSTPDTLTAPGTKSHSYNKVGTFTATLTVTDSLGATVVSKISKY